MDIWVKVLIGFFIGLIVVILLHNLYKWIWCLFKPKECAAERKLAYQERVEAMKYGYVPQGYQRQRPQSGVTEFELDGKKVKLSDQTVRTGASLAEKLLKWKLK